MVEQLQHMLRLFEGADPTHAPGYRAMAGSLRAMGNEGLIPPSIDLKRLIPELPAGTVYHHPHFIYLEDFAVVYRTGSDEPRDVPAREARLLQAFTRHPNRVLTRHWLIDAMCNDPAGAETAPEASLRMHISRLRKIIGWEGSDCNGQSAILAVSGLGYKLHDPTRFPSAENKKDCPGQVNELGKQQE